MNFKELILSAAYNHHEDLTQPVKKGASQERLPD
jgi:hypothetical protein